MLVMTATSGDLRIEIIWKLDSSTTARSSGPICSMRGSSGNPMLPPKKTLKPCAFKNSAITEVVVVLPSEPVTA